MSRRTVHKCSRACSTGVQASVEVPHSQPQPSVPGRVHSGVGGIPRGDSICPVLEAAHLSSCGAVALMSLSQLVYGSGSQAVAIPASDRGRWSSRD